MNVCQSPWLVEEIFNAKLEKAKKEDNSSSFSFNGFDERKATIETSRPRQPSGQKRIQNTVSLFLYF
jgi:hypothetical protein